MANLRKLEFYNYETGEPYPYWFGIAWHLVVSMCYITGGALVLFVIYKLLTNS